MSNELELLKAYVKENIPAAEILDVSHTERIFHQENNECESHSIAKGILVIIKHIS